MFSFFAVPLLLGDITLDFMNMISITVKVTATATTATAGAGNTNTNTNTNMNTKRRKRGSHEGKFDGLANSALQTCKSF